VTEPAPQPAAVPLGRTDVDAPDEPSVTGVSARRDETHPASSDGVFLHPVPDQADPTPSLPGAPEAGAPRDHANVSQAPPLGRSEAQERDVLATWELVRAAQHGDPAAFGQLYDRYVDMVFRYVLFRVNDRLLAEDLTSETFLRALRRIASVSYQGKDVGAWFVTIARNLVLDHVKSSRYRLEVPTAEFRDSDSSDDPEGEAVAGAVQTVLLQCVGQLGDDQRECISLRFLQGLSVAETAAVMGRAEGAVKALQHRAVRRLASLVPADLR
jgi:RNA polymerase sigma-70 factor (ECF subfamily)